MTEQTATGVLNSADVVTMPKDEALAKFEEYSAAVKRCRSAQDVLLAQTYYALAQGQGILNVVEAIKKGGVHEATYLPKLAIMRADQEFAHFERAMDGAGFYSNNTRNYLSHRVKTAQAARQQFELPAHTLAEKRDGRTHYQHYWSMHRAPLPLIPPALRPADALAKYCILWEVPPDGWTRVEPPRPPHDPMLLKPIGQTGLYVVVAHWDLTPIERMVLGALLGQ